MRRGPAEGDPFEPAFGRLVAPGERRGGHGVRDVVRIQVATPRRDGAPPPGTCRS